MCRYRYFKPLLLLLLICAVNLFVTQLHLCGAEEPLTLLAKAEEQFSQKKYSEALSLYEKAIEGDPSLVPAYRGIVRSYHVLGDKQGAVVFLESLFLEYPDSPEIYYGLGYALYTTEKYERARTYFEKAIELKPDMAEAWNNCAAIYHFITRDYTKAKKYYERAIALSSKSGNERVLNIARKNLANLPRPEEIKPLQQELSLEEFLNLFIARVDEKNERAVGLLVLGQQENSEHAMEWFLGEALKAAATDSIAEEEKAVLLARVLEKHYRKSFSSDALHNRLAEYSGLDAAKKKDLYQGESLLNGGVEMEERGSFDAALQRYEAARQCFERIGDTGRKGLALLYQGDVYRRLKKYHEAGKAYSEALTGFIALRDDPQRALALSSLGITYSLMGEYEDGLDFLKRSLSIYNQLHDDVSAKKVQQNITMLEQRIKKQSRQP